MRVTGVLACCLLLAAACDREQLGLPRVPLSVASPDGRAIAFVRNHASLDPPAQSVWLQEGDSARRLRVLGPDSDWCDTIRWSADGSTVAYLIQDARLLVADRRSGRIIDEKWLTEWRGEYPPYRVVEGLALSPDGREARFRDCRRPGVYGRRPDGGFGFELRECSDRVMQIR